MKSLMIRRMADNRKRLSGDEAPRETIAKKRF
jgi:hypothetical protein